MIYDKTGKNNKNNRKALGQGNAVKHLHGLELFKMTGNEIHL